MNFEKFLRTPFLQNSSRGLLLSFAMWGSEVAPNPCTENKFSSLVAMKTVYNFD